MLTPNGLSADDRDPVMRLQEWAKVLDKENQNSTKPMIYAGMGKPTFRVNLHIVEIIIAYWQALQALIQKELNAPGTVKESVAIDYGDGSSDLEPREIMAKAMTSWYESSITAENVLFTVGGAGALRIIFETFNKLNASTPKYRVITPFPHYSLYKDNDKHILHPVDVMKEPGYRLTAKALEESIFSAYELAKTDNCPPKAVLLCNPSNPLGTVITEGEWKDIASVLRKYPDLKIVIDEAYAEMYWPEGQIPSVLKYAPELKNRIVLLRSATKALSSAGERYAMLMTFDAELMNELRNKNISTIGHAPRSSQVAYAHAMAHFDDKEKQALKEFYYPKVQYVWQRAQEMGAAMPDPLYRIDSTFYVLCDLSELLGEEIPTAAQRALDKGGKITTSEELIYSLLFQESLMLAAGSYFGLPTSNGIVRITCSGNEQELKDMMDRIETSLLQARKRKNSSLRSEINYQLSVLDTISNEKKKVALMQFDKIIKTTDSPLELKKQNTDLVKLLDNIKEAIRIYKTAPSTQIEEDARARTALILQSFMSQTQPQKAPVITEEIDLDIEWTSFVNGQCSPGPLKEYLLKLNDESKNTYLPWIEHIKTIKTTTRVSDKEPAMIEITATKTQKLV